MPSSKMGKYMNIFETVVMLSVLLYTCARNRRLYVRLTGGGGKDLIRPTVPDKCQFRPTLLDGDYVRFAQINALFLHFARLFRIPI